MRHTIISTTAAFRYLLQVLKICNVCTYIRDMNYRFSAFAVNTETQPTQQDILFSSRVAASCMYVRVRSATQAPNKFRCVLKFIAWDRFSKHFYCNISYYTLQKQFYCNISYHILQKHFYYNISYHILQNSFRNVVHEMWKVETFLKVFRNNWCCMGNM